jgi:hypothetical protein
MAAPNSRDTFKDYCLRKLGFPVIQINIDDDQLEDCVDRALQYFQDFHHNGTERTYLQHQITQEDIDNRYLTVSSGVIGIIRVFPITNSQTVSMFDARYQMRLNELYDFTNVSYVYYTMMQTHLRMIDMLFTGEKPIRYNRNTDRLNIDWDWNALKVGQYVIMEGTVIVDPDTYTKTWNDRMLKRLATAYIKEVWGNNLKKFGGMQLPGGITMNGQQIYDEAVKEIDEIEKSIRLEHEEPPTFFVA